MNDQNTPSMRELRKERSMKADPKQLAIMLVGSIDALFSHLANSGQENPFTPIPSLVFSHMITPLMTDPAAMDKDKQK